MRGRMTPGKNDRCVRCMMRLEHCVCEKVSVFESPVPIVVVRHWKERHKPSNTARLAALAISNLQVVDYGAPGTTWEPSTLELPNPALLFPSHDEQHLPYDPKSIVVVDGSWPQARKLVNKLPGLQSMPRISVRPLPVPPVRLRQPPVADGMSTIEAIGRLMERLGAPDDGSRLDALYAAVVEATIAARGHPLR